MCDPCQALLLAETVAFVCLLCSDLYLLVCRCVHSPCECQGQAAVADVCDPPPPQPAVFQLLAGPDGIRQVMMCPLHLSDPLSILLVSPSAARARCIASLRHHKICVWASCFGCCSSKSLNSSTHCLSVLCWPDQMV